MRSLMRRFACVAALCCGSVVAQAQACTNQFSTVAVGHFSAATTVFVPTVVSSVATLSAAAPVAVQMNGLGVSIAPQAIVVPQATAVQQLIVPNVFQQQVIRQRIRTTTVPRMSVRSLICR